MEQSNNHYPIQYFQRFKLAKLKKKSIKMIVRLTNNRFLLKIKQDLNNRFTFKAFLEAVHDYHGIPELEFYKIIKYAHDNYILSVIKQDTNIITGSYDGEVKIWKVDNLELIRSIKIGVVIEKNLISLIIFQLKFQVIIIIRG